MEVVLVMETPIQRGTRSKQPTWVWLMTLTAHKGRCVYCNSALSTTLDHEEPVASNGADTWWNFLPACKPCNDWKGARTPTEWLIDQKLHREHPTHGFDTRRMPMRMFEGFAERIERVRREVREPGRLDWFRHHYGDARYRNKDGMAEHLRACGTELAAYPHLPWMTPNVSVTAADVCTRHMCCGWRHPHARHLAVILTDEQYAAFKNEAFDGNMSERDLASKLIARHLAGRTVGGAGAIPPTRQRRPRDAGTVAP